MEIRPAKLWGTEPAEAPPAVPWDDYRNRVLGDWRHFLDGPPAAESAYQQFLVNHPSMLPLERRHASWPYMVVTQPEMKGFLGRTPDFMTIEENSARLRAVLFEIERPDRRWATEKGQQHEHLTHAHQQIKEWRVWFQSPARASEFQKHYGLTTREYFEQRYVLIHGREAEANRHDVFARTRKELDTDEMRAMTFDRLEPDANQSEVVTVRRIVEHRRDQPKFELVGIPACFRFTLYPERMCAAVRLNPGVVRAAPYMPPERAEYIIRQWPIKADEGRKMKPTLLMDFGN